MIANVARVTRAVLTHPLEALDRIRGRLEIRRFGIREEFYPNPSSADSWKMELHQFLGARWPCEDMQRYERVYRDIVSSIGIGNNDPDPSLGFTFACAIRHLRAERVVEAGVARGVSTRLALEAVRDNGRGHLWSIDLPYVTAQSARQHVLAVTPDLHEHWTFVRGSTRRKLAPLLDQIGPITVFMRDTLPTPRTVLEELETAWAHLNTGGLVISDDVHWGPGFKQFIERHSPQVFLPPLSTRPGLIGVARK